MKKNNKNFILWAIVLGALSVALRLLPHAPNFAPVGALAVFTGVYLPKKWGIGLPVAVMLISDFFIGFYDWKLMAVVYVSFFVMVGIGYLVRKKKNLTTIMLGIFGGSFLFFLATNFAVWIFSSWYPHTFNGLMFSYVLALPFFRNSLVGNLFYGTLFFGVYELLPFLRKVFQKTFTLSPKSRLVNIMWKKSRW